MSIKYLKLFLLCIALTFLCNACVIHSGFQICFHKQCVWDPIFRKIRRTQKAVNIRAKVVSRKISRKLYAPKEPSEYTSKKENFPNNPTKDSSVAFADKPNIMLQKTDSVKINPVVTLKDSSAKTEVKDTLPRLTKTLRINYPNDDANISELDKQNIRAFINSFDINQIKKIHIIGYTDNKGSSRYNKALSLNRAKIITNYLLELGIKQAKLSYAGLAEKFPVSTIDTPEERRKNRRTEIIIE